MRRKVHDLAHVKALAVVSTFSRPEFGFCVRVGNREETSGTNRVERAVRLSAMREIWAGRWGHGVLLLCL
jgi:hypothetical protein